MKKLIAFVLTNLMATTFVFAEHTRAHYQNDIQTILNGLDQVNAEVQNKSLIRQCSPKMTRVLVKKINQRIAKAQNSNESLNQSIEIELEKFSKLKIRQAKMTKKTLRWRWRTNRAYKKMRRSFPELTKAEFINNLKTSISTETVSLQKEELRQVLISSGSMENYLLDMRDKIENCDQAFFDNSTMGLIFIILFIGLPVIAILAALFAVIFGAFAWALGLTIFGIGMLLIFFVWGNLSIAQVQRTPDQDDLDLI